MSQDAADRLIVALDVEDIDKAKQAVESLAGTVRWVQGRHTAFYRHGPSFGRIGKRGWLQSLS